MLPMLGAVEAWTVVFRNLPASIQNYITVVLFFFIVSSLLNRLLRL